MLKIVGLILIALFVLLSCEAKKEEAVESDSSSVILIPVDAPAWYQELPQSNEYIYGKGMAVSRRVTIAREKALLLAQADLAEKIKKEVLAVEGIELNRGVIKEQHKTQDGDHWRVYVLLEMPQKQEMAQ